MTLNALNGSKIVCIDAAQRSVHMTLNVLNGCKQKQIIVFPFLTSANRLSNF